MSEKKVNTGLGLIDNLLNEGSIPEVRVTITNDTYIKISLTIVICAALFFMLQKIIKK
ncbi:MAG: hypothetical protein M9888_03840 [Chitinophagales bacterium]|nr:hypothetical protein [Chitinophagales bacterium]